MNSYNYIYKASFQDWGYVAKKVDYDAPVEKWPHQKNNIEHLVAQLNGRNLLAQKKFTKEDIDILKDCLIEIFYRRLPAAFEKVVGVMFHQDPGFARSALIEAARQGQQHLLKYALTLACQHSCIDDMICASLIGNQLSTAVWLIDQSGQKFGMSQTDLYDLNKKSNNQRQKIFFICIQYGNVDQIFHNIENLRYDGVKCKLMSDWNTAKHTYVENQREKPLLARLSRKI